MLQGFRLTRPVALNAMAIALLTVLAAWNDTAHAHGVGHVPETLNAEAIRFYYSDGTPMAFAEATLFDPEGVEHQNARTDAKGRIAVLLDKPGSWRLVVSDGMGHRSEMTIAAGADSSTARQPSGNAEGPSGLTATLLGLSLLGNIAMSAALLRRRNA